MLVAAKDRTINADLERWYAKRAHSHTVEVAGSSHSVYVSHPIGGYAGRMSEKKQHTETSVTKSSRLCRTLPSADSGRMPFFLLLVVILSGQSAVDDVEAAAALARSRSW
jgi:hypothetical protein